MVSHGELRWAAHDNATIVNAPTPRGTCSRPFATSGSMFWKYMLKNVDSLPPEVPKFKAHLMLQPSPLASALCNAAWRERQLSDNPKWNCSVPGTLCGSCFHQQTQRQSTPPKTRAPNQSGQDNCQCPSPEHQPSRQALGWPVVACPCKVIEGNTLEKWGLYAQAASNFVFQDLISKIMEAAFFITSVIYENFRSITYSFVYGIFINQLSWCRFWIRQYSMYMEQ